MHNPKFKRRTSKGGFLSHIVNEQTRVAVCGYKPKADLPAGRRMVFRHGWRSDDRTSCRHCAKCDLLFENESSGAEAETA